MPASPKAENITLACKKKKPEKKTLQSSELGPTSPQACPSVELSQVRPFCKPGLRACAPPESQHTHWCSKGKLQGTVEGLWALHNLWAGDEVGLCVAPAAAPKSLRPWPSSSFSTGCTFIPRGSSGAKGSSSWAWGARADPAALQGPQHPWLLELLTPQGWQDKSTHIWFASQPNRWLGRTEGILN